MKSQEKFKERVWNATKRIPCGKVSTYAMVAYSIGHAGAARAVGNALNQNCNPEVPCHRVVRSGGFIGGFAHGSIKKVPHFVVRFAVGALLGVALLELIPEAVGMTSLEMTMPLVLFGILVFFVLEKFLFWYHCHDGQCPVHTYNYLILWGDFLHNFIDCAIIALTFMADVRLGVLTTIAVIFHEIPQEIGDFGILLHGGFSKAKALFYNFL